MIWMGFHHVISMLDLLIFILGGVVSLISSGHSSLPHADNSCAAAHREIVLTAVDVIGEIAVMVFTLAGITVGVVVVAIGTIVLIHIHVLINVSLTAFLVFSMNLLYLLGWLTDSVDLMVSKLVMKYDIIY